MYPYIDGSERLTLPKTLIGKGRVIKKCYFSGLTPLFHMNFAHGNDQNHDLSRPLSESHDSTLFQINQGICFTFRDM
jgi:hypothetical protein